MSRKEDKNTVAAILHQAAQEFTDDVPSVSAAPPVAGNGQPRVRRSRSWESKPENKGFTYRIGQDVHNLVTNAVEQYGRAGHHATTGAVARAWLLAGYQAWMAGQVEVEVDPSSTRKKLRVGRP